MRGTKLGDTVAIRLIGKALTPGVIVAIDSAGLRCVATVNGERYAAPDELHACSSPVAAKHSSELAIGDRIVLMTGETGCVASLSPLSVAGPRSTWRLPSVLRDWVLADQ